MRHHLRIVSLLVVALATAVLAPALASAAFQLTGTPTVTFTATGSMSMRFTGTTHDLTVADDGTQLTVTVRLTRLTTGIALRDRHTRDHLDVAHHGTAQLVVPLASLRVPTGAATSGTARGTLRIKGRTQPVSFTYRAERASNGQVRVHGTARIDYTTFGIQVPSYLGITLRKEIELAADFTLRPAA